MRSGRIPWAKPVFWGREREYVQEALTSTWISGGPFVERLERGFAAYVGAPYAVSMSNGTTALHAAYLALGLGAGDEVVVPGFAFQAAANVALHVGARPVFAEVDPNTWCVTAADIEKCLSPRTRAVVVVHTYGNVCSMDEIVDLARRRDIPIIEDAAEAFSSKYKGRLAGTMGDIGTFSFQATKTITTGEGGMVVTANGQLHDRMCLYRNHGMRDRRYWHELPGHNFRLTNLQAALGCAQMESLDHIIRERKRVHRRYRLRLAEIPGLAPQHFPDEVDPVLWAIAVRLDQDAYPQGRDAVMHQLEEEGLETRPAFYAASLMAMYECPSIPVCEEISASALSLPTYPTLEDEEIDIICERLRRLRR